MKRMKVLFGQRRVMVLVTLTVLVLAAAALIASSASFTATSANPNNVFTSGSLSITNDKDTAGPVHHAVISANGMVPGQSVNGTVVIGNGGTSSGLFTLNSTVTGDAAFTAYLDLTVEQDGVSIYTGKFSGMTPSIALIGGASWAGGVTHSYKITVAFPNAGAGAENALMAKTAQLDLAWSAVSN
jgi:hypothetical protein